MRLRMLKIELDWYKGQNDWFESFELYVDLGYQGIKDDFKTLVDTRTTRMKSSTNQLEINLAKIKDDG